MTTKATQPAANAPTEAPAAKPDTAEDLRRRRAGIACFL